MVLPFIIGAAGKAILGAVVKKSIEKAVMNVADNSAVPAVTARNEAKVADAMIDMLEKDPAFINATNSEPWYQSGVAWGSTVTALSVLVPIVAGWFGMDIQAEEIIKIGGSIGALVGVGYTLYRRFMPGLTPLFSGEKK